MYNFLKLYILVCSLILLNSCGETLVTDKSATSSAAICAAGTVTVGPHYAGDTDWMDYVKKNGVGLYDSDGTNCDVTDTTRNSCIHAGEIRSAEIVGTTSCTGITGSDANSWFDWSCYINGGGNAVVYSTGLKDTAGLKNMIDTTDNTFLENTLTVAGLNCGSSTSTSAEWGWTNTIQAAPALNPAAVTLSTSLPAVADGNIYYITAGGISEGYNFNRSKVALVGIGNITLTYANAGGNCNEFSFVSAGANQCVLAVPNNVAALHIWVENLTVDGLNIAFPFGVAGGGHSMYRNITAKNSGSIGVRISGSSINVHNNIFNNISVDTTVNQGIRVQDGVNETNGNTFKNISVSNATSWSISVGADNNYFENLTITNGTLYGLYVHTTATGNTFKNVKISNILGGAGLNLANSPFSNKFYNFNISNILANDCIDLFAADSSVFYNFKLSNCSSSGINFNSAQNSNNNIFTKFLIANTGLHGVHYQAGNLNNTFSHIQAMNVADDGVWHNSSDGTFSQVVSLNNGGDGFGDISTLGNIDLFSIASMNNQSFGVTSHDQLEGNLIVGNNGTDCSGNSFPNANCTVTGIDNSSDYTGAVVATSSAVLNSDETSANSFLDHTAIAEATNATGLLSVEEEDSINDWVNFDNEFRFWMLNTQGASTAFPSANQRGGCLDINTNAGIGDCEIFDVILKSSDVVLRNISGYYIANTVNDAFIAGATCPAAVHGNQSLADTFGAGTGANVFLVNAVEIMEDTGANAGDDDGLCETNEACIYSPNMGYYQGSGDYLTNGTCTFTDGTVAGVIMYAYPTN